MNGIATRQIHQRQSSISLSQGCYQNPFCIGIFSWLLLLFLLPLLSSMGIPGLLPLLRSIIRTVHLESYAGKSVAIDAYSWLHKGIYGSALDLLQGKPNRKYIEYCLSRAKVLIGLGVRPILVFDGAALPMKAGKEAERRAAREKSKALVLKALAKGDKSAAWQLANKCVDVTPQLAYDLIQVRS